MHKAFKHLQEFSEQPSFVFRDGKTFKVTKDRLKEIGDFQLKILGMVEEVNKFDENDKEGHWLCACSSDHGGEMVTR
jgi:hypothetical protein